MSEPVGRPLKYKNKEELQKAIDDYFDKCEEEGSKQKITITGLVLHLGFCDRMSFYDYEKRGEFSYTIKTARTRVEQYYEEHIMDKNTATGSIFALKNFGWADKLEVKEEGVKTNKLTIEYIDGSDKD